MNNRRLLAGFSSLLIVASTIMPLRAFAEGTEPPSAPVVLDQAALAAAANVVVGGGQTAVIDFGNLTGGALNITGDLTNHGTIYAFSTNPGVTTGQFFANNITNTSLITSIIPQGQLAGLGLNLSSLVSNFGLSFSAINNIVNSGTISSAGNLAMQAGGSITNSGILSAIQNINMTAASIMNSGTIAAQMGSLSLATASIMNSGIMQALNGSIAMKNLAGTTLDVQNVLGQIHARDEVTFETMGSIKNSSNEYVSKALLSLRGGDISGSAVNFVSPDGDVYVDANSISGPVSIVGGTAVAGVNEGDFNIANLELSGDPIFWDKNNNVNITGAILNQVASNPGQDWVFLAGKNITVSGPSGQTFNTGSGANGSITMAAGVTFSSPATTQGSNNAAVPSYSINAAASTFGGDINLSGLNLQTSGKSVTLIAKAGSSGSGNITVGNITTSGANASSAGANGFNAGAVSINAAGTINTGTILAAGGNGAAGAAGTNGANGNNGGNGGDYSDGGNGVAGTAGTVGGTGGNGGNGGAINVTGVGAISMGLINLSGGGGGAGAVGGSGGKGGNGGSGGNSYVASNAGDGGDGANGANGANGGVGGTGGTGGAVIINGSSTVSLNGIYTLGSFGGSGANGGNGGSGGNGAGGGTAYGAGASGSGGNAGSAGLAGNAGTGGGGGNAGAVTITGLTISGFANGINAYGGNGGAGALGGIGGTGGNGAGGTGGIVSGSGGNGGNAGSGGAGSGGGLGGAGATVIITSLNTISSTAGFNAAGGNGGNGGAGGSGQAGGASGGGADTFLYGGSGGNGGNGGGAGAGGFGGNGGTGGSFAITAVNNITISGNVTTKGGNGGTGGGSGDGGDGNGGSNGGGAIIGGSGGTGGVGGSVAPGGVGGYGGNGGRISLTSDYGSITVGLGGSTRAIDSTGGAGGGGGSGGNGGNGGNGGSSGIGFMGNAGLNGQPAGTGVTVDATLGFGVGNVGADGGLGGFGGNGGMGGGAGSGGDVLLLARYGGITVNGDIVTFGNSGGLPGSPGQHGLNGSNGAGTTYFGLSLSAILNGGQYSATAGLGLGITIDGVTVATTLYKDFKDLIMGGATIPINGLSFYIDDHGSTTGYETHFGASGVTGTLVVNNVVTSTTVSFMSAAVNLVIPSLTGGDFQTVTNNSVPTNPCLLCTPFPTAPMPTTGSSIATFGGAGTLANGPASAGGNVTVVAGTQFTTNGVINAMGGQSLTLVPTGQFTYQALANLGFGGAVFAQAPSITITGGPSGPPVGQATVGAGSVTFITALNGVSYLIKPLVFGQLSWATNYGLNVGNGTGRVLATSGVRVIKNGTGSLDLSAGTTNLFAGGATYQAPGDLVILASGDITAPNAPANALINSGINSSRPNGQIIVAAGDYASTLNYGAGANQQVWMVLGGASTTGGNVDLGNVSFGSGGTALVFMQAHTGTDRAGSITTKNITTAVGTSTIAPGSTYIVSDGNVLTGLVTTGSANLLSSIGNFGTSANRMLLNAVDLSVKTNGAVFISDSASRVVLRESYASGLDLKATAGDLIVNGVVTTVAGVFESTQNVFVKSAVNTLGTNGYIYLISGNSISESNGLSFLNAPNLVLVSNNGNISLSNLTRSNSITLFAASAGSSINANQVNATYVGLYAGSNGINVNSSTASQFVASTTGNLNIVMTGAVKIGTDAALPSTANIFNLTANGKIEVLGPIYATQNILLTTLGGHNIELNKNLSATQNVTLTANGAGSITQINSLISSSSLNLVSGSGNIGTEARPIYSTSSTISFATPGSVYLVNGNANLNLNVGNWTGTNLLIIENGDITVTGNLTASGFIDLFTVGGGSIALNGNVQSAYSYMWASENTVVGPRPLNNGRISQLAGKTLTSPQLNLLAYAGGVGPLKTTSGVITINSTGPVTINNTGTLTINGTSGNLTLNNTGTTILSTFTATGALSATSSGNLSTTGWVVGNSLTFTVTGSNSDIILGNNINVTNLSKFVTGNNGAITQTGGTLSSGSVEFQAQNGSIGQFGVKRINMVTGQITANTKGDVYINNTGSVVLKNSTTGVNGDYDLTNEGGVTLGGTIEAFNGNASDNIIINVSGNGSITRTGGVLEAKNVYLTVGSANIGTTSARVFTDTDNLTITSGGNAYLSNDGSVKLLASSAGNGSTFDLITTNNGGIEIASGVQAGSGTIARINLTAGGSGNISRTSGILVAGRVDLTSGTGNIGATNAFITTDADTLALNTGGSVYVTNNGDLTLLDSSAGANKTFKLNTTNNGSITLNGDVDVFLGAIDLIELNANGAGNILRQSGVLEADLVTLISGSGNIGALGADISTNADFLSANTTGGNVYITNSGTVTLLASSAGDGKTFSLKTTLSGSILIDGGVQAANGLIDSIDLSASLLGAIDTNSGRLVADKVNLVSALGNIGFDNDPVLITANQLKAQTLTGNAFVQETDDVNLITSFAGATKTFWLSAGDAITVADSQLVSGGNIHMITNQLTLAEDAKVTALAGNFVLDTNNLDLLVTLNQGALLGATGDIEINAPGSIVINMEDTSKLLAGGDVKVDPTSIALVIGDNVLFVAGGDIALDASGLVTIVLGDSSLLTAGGNLVVDAGTSVDISTGSTSLLSTGNDLMLTADDGSIIVRTGDLSLMTVGGSLVLNAGRSIDVSTGDLSLMTVGENLVLTAGRSIDVRTGDLSLMTVGENLVLTAGRSIDVRTGDLSVMKADENLVFNATDRSIDVRTGNLSVMEAGENLVMNAGRRIDVRTGELSVMRAGDNLVLNADRSIDVRTGNLSMMEAGENLVMNAGRSIDIRTGELSAMNAGEDLVLNADRSIDIDTGNVSILAANDDMSINAGRYISIKTGRTSMFAAGDDLNIDADRSLVIDTGARSFFVAGGDMSIEGGDFGSIEINTGRRSVFAAGGNLTIDADWGASVYITTGNRSIIAAGGDLEINASLLGGSIDIDTGRRSLILVGDDATFNSGFFGSINIDGGANAGSLIVGDNVVLNSGGFGTNVTVDLRRIVGEMYVLDVRGGSVAITTEKGDLNFGSGINVSSYSFIGTSGGSIELHANGGDINAADKMLLAKGYGIGNEGGLISISALGDITVGLLDARGFDGANGGTILDPSEHLMVTLFNDNGASIDVSSIGGNGGYIRIETFTPDTFNVVLTQGATNGTAGAILANGEKGGRIDIYLSGVLRMNADPDRNRTRIQANGLLDSKSGPTGGIIYIDLSKAISNYGSNTDFDVWLDSDTLIMASASDYFSGKVGIHVGPDHDFNIAGAGIGGHFGKIIGGEYFNMGNLNPADLTLETKQAGKLDFRFTIGAGTAIGCNFVNCADFFPKFVPAKTQLEIQEGFNNEPIDLRLLSGNATVETDRTRGRVPDGTYEEQTDIIEMQEQTADNDNATWIIVTNSSQPYVLPGDNNAIVFATPGTIFMLSGDHQVTLQQGSLTVIAGGDPISVQTGHGSVNVGQSSAAGISQDQFGGVTVANLMGNDTTFNVTHNDESSATVIGQGTAMHVVSSQVATAGASDTVYGSGLQLGPVDGLSSNTSNFNPATSPFVTSLTSSNNFNLTPGMRSSINAFLNAIGAGNHIGFAHPSLNGQSITYAYTDGRIVPVAYTTPANVGKAAEELMSLDVPQGSLRYVGWVELGSNKQSIVLYNGEVLVNADRPMEVSVWDNTVSVGRGVIGLVGYQNGVLKVRNLGERSVGCISVSSGGKYVKLRAGQELVIGSDDKVAISSTKADGIARRRMEKIAFADKQAVYGEFSTLSLLEKHSLLSKLIHSKKPKDKSTVDQIVKAGASLSLVTASRGAYQ